jgi:hypothetical protein
MHSANFTEYARDEPAARAFARTTTFLTRAHYF